MAPRHEPMSAGTLKQNRLSAGLLVQSFLNLQNPTDEPVAQAGLNADDREAIHVNQDHGCSGPPPQRIHQE